MKRIVLAVFVTLFGAAVQAGDWAGVEPAPGSQLRRDILAAIRPAVEWNLNSEIEFVVTRLQVDQGRAWAVLSPQRPGGAPINISETTLVKWFQVPPSQITPPVVSALLVENNGHWALVDYNIGGGAAWYERPPYCYEFGDLIGGACLNWTE